MAVELTWLGHASFKIAGSAVVYIDPWKLSGQDRAHVILVSHSHYDHLSEDDVRALAGVGTKIIATADCVDKLGDLDVRRASPGDQVTIDTVTVQAVAAYNVDKAFHPKASNWLGFVVTLDGTKIYYAGDTDAVAEMDDLPGDIDVALMPVGGTYTMTAAEAAEALGRFRPRLAVPYHWGDIVGEAGDAETFQTRADVPVAILQPGESLTVK